MRGGWHLFAQGIEIWCSRSVQPPAISITDDKVHIVASRDRVGELVGLCCPRRRSPISTKRCIHRCPS
ncbi:protein of unknown function (plasmid) [Thiomonas sp. Sup16B3]|nr:protein of unknown function [Thiomonas sp. Sup16B3]